MSLVRILILALLCWPTVSQESSSVPQPMRDCPEIPKDPKVANFANQFSCHYNNWVRLEYEREIIGSVDVKALQEWNKAWKAFKELKVVVEHEY